MALGQSVFRIYKQGWIFIFFHRRSGKILGEVQVICNMSFIWEGHEMANQSVPGGK